MRYLWRWSMVPLMVLVACGSVEDPGVTRSVSGDGDPGSVTTSPVASAPPTTSPVASAPPTTSPVTTSPATTSAAPPVDLEGFSRSVITIGGEALQVAVAEDRAQRSQGLMFVTDLGDLDGMLFVFDVDSTGGFWMKNTLIPLDIVWFDSTGAWVGATTMVPCVADPCPTYGPGAPYRYAVEAPASDLAFVGSGSRLVLTDR